MKKQQKKKGKKGTKKSATQTAAAAASDTQDGDPADKEEQSPSTETKAEEVDSQQEQLEDTTTQPENEDKLLKGEGIEKLKITDDDNELKQELQTAESKIKELEAKLEAANQTVSELESANLELTKNAKPQVEEYEEGPGPQIGGEASGEFDEPSLEINSLKHKIESLNVENEYLSDKVYTLEAKVANLIAINKRVSLDFPRGESPDFDSDASIASPLPSIKDSISTGARNNTHRPRLSSFAEMDLYGEAARVPEIEKEMERWKGWQVDMRGWRSLGIGPTFEI